jgi:hypothetical protein
MYLTSVCVPRQTDRHTDHGERAYHDNLHNRVHNVLAADIRSSEQS